MIVVRRLVWDGWNVAHIARHDVTPAEVEQACHGPHLVREGHSGRIMLIGLTTTGRLLTVILGHEEEGVYYPVTARPADRKERALFRATFNEGGQP